MSRPDDPLGQAGGARQGWTGRSAPRRRSQREGQGVLHDGEGRHERKGSHGDDGARPQGGRPGSREREPVDDHRPPTPAAETQDWSPTFPLGVYSANVKSAQDHQTPAVLVLFAEIGQPRGFSFEDENQKHQISRGTLS